MTNAEKRRRYRMLRESGLNSETASASRSNKLLPGRLIKAVAILGGVALFVALNAKQTAGAGVGLVPSIGEIAAAPDFNTLDSYYESINAALLSGQLNQNAYDGLYDAYAIRFTELIGAI